MPEFAIYRSKTHVISDPVSRLCPLTVRILAIGGPDVTTNDSGGKAFGHACYMGNSSPLQLRGLG